MVSKPIHPGKHLAEQIREMEISAAELARQIKVPTNRITEIMNGQRSVTVATQRCASGISSAQARNTGLTYKCSMSCAKPKRSVERL